jgi:hypothetical protein
MFNRKVSKTREKLNRGLAHLENGLYKAAIKNFEAAVRKKDGSNLERDVAALWMVNAAKYRREWKKRRFGNANLFWYSELDHTRKAWSDVDIAAVLLTPSTSTLNDYLSKFLGRTPEAIRFQRRYAYGRPLSSWVGESGKRYTRYTQTNYVKSKLGV